MIADREAVLQELVFNEHTGQALYKRGENTFRKLAGVRASVYQDRLTTFQFYSIEDNVWYLVYLHELERHLNQCIT